VEVVSSTFDERRPARAGRTCDRKGEASRRHGKDVVSCSTRSRASAAPQVVCRTRARSCRACGRRTRSSKITFVHARPRHHQRRFARMVRRPPPSMLRAAPKKRFGFWSAFASTPPTGSARVRHHPLWAARRVIESSRITRLAVLDETLRLFDHHVRDLALPVRRLVERRRDEPPPAAPLRLFHVGHLFGPLVDEQHDQVDLG